MLLLLTLLLLVGVQCWALYGLGCRSPVGDEKEYLARAVSEDPYAPGFFLRPPGMAFVAHLLGSEGRIRLAIATAGCVTAALLTTATWLANGSLAAFLALLWLLLPERLIHACHIWPDTLLGVVTAGMVLVFSMPDPGRPLPVLSLGLLAMLGSLIRVDFVCLAPLSGLGLLASARPLDISDWLLLLLPTTLALTLWTLRNGRRYGRWQYDDTWAFNVMVAGEQAATAPPGQAPALEPTVAKVASQWSDLSTPARRARARRTLGQLFSRPSRLLDRAVRRALTLVGPDTFVRQMLLPQRAAYPELTSFLRRLLEPPLRSGFPLLVTVCLLGTLLTRSAPPAYALAIAGSLLAGILFHQRTRHRVAAMPVLVAWAADVSVRSGPLLRGSSAGFVTLLVAVGLGLVWLLGRIDFGRELPEA